MMKIRYFSAKNLFIAMLYAILPLTLLILIVLDINPTGYRQYVYSLSRPSAVISPLFPEQRLTAVNGGQQTVVSEPIYFTVRYPHRYETADVRIETINAGNLAWEIGLQAGPDSAWAYDLKQPDEEGRAWFDMSSAYVQNRQLRFIVSVEGLGQGSFFAIKNIVVNLRRPSLLNLL